MADTVPLQPRRDREPRDREPRDRIAGPTTTARIVGRGREPVALTILIVAFLAVAIIKPWAGPTASPHLVQGPTPQPSIPAAFAGPSLPTSAWIHCGEPLGWRVYTRESFVDQIVRAWRSVEPAKAALGPLDPVIPLVQVGPVIDALGFCAPWTGADRAPDGSVVSVWRIDPTGPRGPTLELVPLESLVADMPSALGGLYRPATNPDHARVVHGGGWAIGRYVFSIQATGWERWWAVESSRPRS
jgi:hypothetical protein